MTVWYGADKPGRLNEECLRDRSFENICGGGFERYREVGWFVRMRGVWGMDTLPMENCGKQGLSIYSLRNTFIRSHKGFKFFSLISHSHTTI